jgi:hypothetical protein
MPIAESTARPNTEMKATAYPRRGGKRGKKRKEKH